METSEPVADGYDAVYAALPNSPTFRSLWREHALGKDYPDGFEHISFLTLPELTHMAAVLDLRPGGVLVDLACGAGGPGLWVARQSGAQLTGIDISAVGIAQAAARARELGLAAHSQFMIGAFDQTRLESGSVEAVMSVDALQYAPSKRAAFREASRILRLGGRFAFTAFELEPERAAGLPVLGTDPVDDYRPLLADAGFAIELYEETAGWCERLTTTYQAIIDALAILTDEMGQPGAAALALEVSLTLERQPYRRRVFAAATKR